MAVLARVFWASYWLIVALVSTAAIALVMAYGAFAILPIAASQIESELEERLHVDIDIADIKTRWDGVNPYLLFKGIRVKSSDGASSLDVAQLELQLDVLASLHWRQLLFSQLYIDSPDIHVNVAQELPATRQAPATQPSSAMDSQDVLWLTSLVSEVMRQPNIRMNNGHVVLVNENKQVAEVSGVHVFSEGASDFGQVTASALIVAPNGSSAAINAVIEAGLSRGAPLRVVAETTELTQEWINGFLPLELFQFTRVTGRQNLYAEIVSGEIQHLQSTLALTDLEANGFVFESLHAQVDLLAKQEQGAHQLQASLSVTDKNSQVLSLPKVIVDFDAGLAHLPTLLAVDEFDIAPLVQFVTEQAATPDVLVQNLNGLNLRGNVSQVIVGLPSMPVASSYATAVNVMGTGQVDDFNMDPWAGAPGLSHLDANFSFMNTTGFFDIDSKNIEMYFPKLGVEPWPFETAQGRLHWRFEKGRVSLLSDVLSLSQQQTSASGRFAFRLPFDVAQQPELTLMIGAEAAPLIDFMRYIPPKEIGEDIHQWIGDAFSTGIVRQGSFVLNGETRSSLDNWQRPSVNLYLDVEGADFAFDKAWPSLAAQQARLMLRDGAFVSEVVGGQLYQSDIVDGAGWLDAPLGELKVVARAQGPLADIHTILTDSPVAKELGSEPQKWQFTEGEATTSLALSIPTQGQIKQPNALVVTSKISQGQVAAEVYDLAFNELDADVTYSLASGLSVPHATAAFLGNAVSAQVTTIFPEGVKQNTKADPHFQVSFQGKVGMEQLEGWLSLPPLAVASGEMGYEGDVVFCQSSIDCNRLRVRSDLIGVEIEGFEGFDKAALTPWKSDLSLSLDAQEQHMRLSVSDQLQAIFMLQGGEVERGTLAFSDLTPSLPSESGLWVEGHFKRLDIDGAKGFLERAGILSVDNSTEVSSAPNAGGQGLFKAARFKANTAFYGDHEFSDVEASVHLNRKAVMLDLSGPDTAGRVTFPVSQHLPIQVHLERLHLHTSANSAALGAGADHVGETDVTPKDLPYLIFSTEAVAVDSMELGAWSFTMLPDDWGVTFQGIRGQLSELVINGDARWSKAGEEYTAALLDVTGSDLGQAMATFGFDDVIESEAIDSDIRLVWRGAPWQFELANLSGEFAMTLDKGRLIDVAESNLLLRGLGVLNLETLTRRLRLDFSDITKQGIAFDELELEYNLLDGVAKTKGPSKLSGPSLDLEMVGDVDLSRQQLNQTVKVMLPVSKNLPLMGLLLGQPQIAGAVYLFDKLIGEKIERITAINYRIQGSWDSPNVELMTANPQKSEG